MGLSRDFMLERMRANDAAYDGKFIVGVHSTGIYCLPSCRARLPKPENVRFYPTISEAREQGLRPCKKCRPDESTEGLDPVRDTVYDVLNQVRECPAEFDGVSTMADAAMMSLSSFHSYLRENYQMSPGEILTRARINKARRVLRIGQTVAEAQAASGYESSSAFYDNFRKLTGATPAAYRELRKRDSIELELPADFQTEFWLKYVGRDPQSRTEWRSGNRAGLVLWNSGVPVVVDLEVAGRTMGVTYSGAPEPHEIVDQLARMLGLDQDVRDFEEHVRSLGQDRLIAGRTGLRIPQTATFFDGIVWCIVGQQVNLTFAFTLRRRLAELMGREVEGGRLAPPTAKWLSELDPEVLLGRQFSRRKAEYLVGTAKAICSGSLSADALETAPRDLVESALLRQRGIGPWAANYLMMRSLGMPDALPVGDTGIAVGLARHFGVERPGKGEMIELMRAFQPHRSLASFHLWQSLATDY